MEIDRQLGACGWIVQDYKKLNLGAGIGVAVREFKMSGGYDAADYLLFVNRRAAGVIEAKKAARRSRASSGSRPNTPRVFRREFPRS